MPTPADNTIQAPLDMFTAGRLAMLIDGTWDLPPLVKITKFNVGVAVIPSGKGKSVSTAFTDSFVVLKGSAHANEARQALIHPMQSFAPVTAWRLAHWMPCIN